MSTATGSAAGLVDTKPYVGHDSYQAQDKAFFFGRDQDASLLVARALASPYTLLHARSGVGKTSLLNARLIPDVEARGWTPVRTVPYDDPLVSLRTATLHALLIPPSVEAAAISRAADALGPDEDDLTVSDLVARYDALEARDLRAVRPLISPVPLNAWGRKETTPFFCRLLRSSIEENRFGAHLAFLTDGGRLSPGLNQVDGATSIRWLLETLRSPSAQSAYLEVTRQAQVPGRSLRPFLERIFGLWRRTTDGANLGLLFILDQFEEMFTRFVAEPSTGRPLREGEGELALRRELFQQLEDLHASPLTLPGSSPQGPRRHAPIRWVISMRSEYIAQLDELPRLFRELQDSQYRLRLLNLQQACDAVVLPAQHFGYGYSEKALEVIFGALKIEGRYIEPGHIQIVCEKLWMKHGRNLTRWATGGPAEERIRVIGKDLVGDADAVRGLVQGAAVEFLSALPDDLERASALDLLSGLITADRTRNVLTKRQLIEAPFRHPDRRERLLRRLVPNIIRLEYARGELFVEIAHEFLIPPILKAMASVEGYAQLRDAMRSLERFESRDVRDGSRAHLQPSELQNLHAVRDQIRWPFWAVELMLRSAIRHEPGSPVLRYWAERLDTMDPACGPHPDGWRALLVGRTERRTLALYELRELDRARGEVPRHPDLLSAIARSWVQKAVSGEHPAITFWMEQLRDV
jgi:hypothetical protein